MNINEYVWVKLTKEGYIILLESNYPIHYIPKEGEYWSFPLFILMRIFGPSLWVGMLKPLFHNNEILMEKPIG